jgi:hypothetical protein
MHENTAHALYWIPPGFSVDQPYIPTINGYLGNVVRYRATFGGSATDTSASRPHCTPRPEETP